MGKDLTSYYIYVFYIVIMLVWNASLIAPPLLALGGQEEIADSFYNFYSYSCHQRLDRSFCFFSDGSFGDCIKNGTVIGPKNLATKRAHSVAIGNLKGYEIPVCARDFALYLAMLVGALAMLFFRKIVSKNIPPPLYLIIAIIPISIDGIGQLLGFWESTNLMRVITGGIAGFVVPFYLLPMLNDFLGKK